jgi:hypothetical protein
MDLNQIVQQVVPPQSAPPGGPAPRDNKKIIIIAAAALIGLSVLGWVGNMIVGKVVGFGMRKAIEAGTGVKIDEKGNTVSFQGKNGQGSVQFSGTDNGGTVKVTDEKGQTTEIVTQENGTAKKLPDGFPSDFPVMSGMTIYSTMGAIGAESSTFTVAWRTAVPREEVAKWINENLKKAGWTITMSTDVDTDSIINFERSPAETVDAINKDAGYYTISAKDTGTEVGLFLTMPKK